MKRFLVIFVLCLAASRCFGISNLVQSNLGGSATATGGSGDTTATTTGSFTTTTTLHNTLFLVAWVRGTQINNSVTNFAVSAPGFTWTPIFKPGGGIVSGTVITTTALYYIKDAAVMSSSVVNTVSADSQFASSVTVEFALLEVSGLTANPYTGNNGTSTPQSGGTPGILVTNAILGAPGTTNLIIMPMSAVGSSIAAGSGFTLGPTAAVATVGQIQFQSGYPRTAATLSFGGTETTWVTGAAVFTEASTSSSGVPRHRGSVF